MATGSELSDEVLDIIQDPSYTEDDVLELFNKVALRIAARVILPALEATAVVIAKAGTATVSLPVNFQRNLFRAKDDIPYNKITVLNSTAQIKNKLQNKWDVPDTLIKAVAAVKPVLAFAPPPVNDTNLTLSYHRKPDLITGDDEVVLLPDGFDDLLVEFACWQLYSKIEQGLEGQKIDTTYHQGLYTSRLDELINALKEGQSRPDPPIAQMEKW